MRSPLTLGGEVSEVLLRLLGISFLYGFLAQLLYEMQDYSSEVDRRLEGDEDSSVPPAA